MRDFILPDMSETLIKTDDIRIGATPDQKIRAALISHRLAWIDSDNTQAPQFLTFDDDPAYSGKQFYGLGDVHKFHKAILESDPTNAESETGLTIINRIAVELAEFQHALDNGDVMIFDPSMN